MSETSDDATDKTSMDRAADTPRTQTTAASPAADPARRSSRSRAAVRGAATTVRVVRTYAARLVWVVCVLAALVLAVSALLIAVKANDQNNLVKGILNLAKNVADVGVFDLDNPIKTFTGSDALIKTALLNYGLGALAWLVVGRILTWVLRPRS